MVKPARSITPPNVGKLATPHTEAKEPANISAHNAKRTRTDTKFLPNKIATAENAAKADKYTPLARLTEAMKHCKSVKTDRGEAAVYWMRMEDLRSMCYKKIE